MRSQERWIGRDRRRADRLEEALQHTDPGVRRDAAVQLGKHGGGRAMRLLLGALHDPDPGVRGAAAEALAGVGTLQAIAPLCRALLDHDAYVARSAAAALGALISHPQQEVRQERQALMVRALAECVEECPASQLRASLPTLRQLFAPWMPIDGAGGESGRALLARLEERMAALEDLPVPAGAPPPSTEQLPIPATAPSPDPSSLPLPSSAPTPPTPPGA